MPFKSGFVAIIGRPNVGKSTLLNYIAGGKVSITSPKPQTTRNIIRAIITRDEYQIIFIDTPGIHKPRNKLGEYMTNMAESTLNEVDMILFLTDVSDKEPGYGDMFIIERLKKVKAPVFLIINKIDTVKKESILPLISAYKDLMTFKDVIPISALNGDGVDIIIDNIVKILPEGPKYFPDDVLTDQPEKLIAAEFIREKILYHITDEVPHGVGVEITEFKEREGKNIIDIEAVIYCERESHKGIIIGKEGRTLKQIGTESRQDMENIFGTKVFLKLWVKVKPDWRNSILMLRNLGYNKN